MAFATTDPISARAFLTPHLAATRAAGFDVHLLSATSPLLQQKPLSSYEAWPISHLVRPISLRQDFLALAETVRILRRLRPRALHVGTPKAGLVVGLAGLAAGIPRRQYVVHGLRYETEHGHRRALLMATEFLACKSATSVVAVSRSVRDRLIRDRLVRPEKIKVLGVGSISGVNAPRFRRDTRAGDEFRVEHHLPLGVPAVLFVGRLAVDKGIRELADAWRQLIERGVAAYLIVVGELDSSQPADAAVLEQLQAIPGVVLTGHMNDPTTAYWASDLLVLPSYREGFGQVILEAAAAGMPAVAPDVTGCRDAIVNGQTGLLVAVGDAEALADAMQALIEDPVLRASMGESALQRAVRDFRETTVVGRYLRDLLS